MGIQLEQTTPPTISKDDKATFMVKHRRVCSNSKNHDKIHKLGGSCNHCDDTGFEYKEYRGQWYPASMLDISHNEKSAWIKNLNKEEYLNPANWFLELKKDNRSRARSEWAYRLDICKSRGQESAMREADIYLLTVMRDSLLFIEQHTNSEILDWLIKKAS